MSRLKSVQKKNMSRLKSVQKKKLTRQISVGSLTTRWLRRKVLNDFGKFESDTMRSITIDVLMREPWTASSFTARATRELYFEEAEAGWRGRQHCLGETG